MADDHGLIGDEYLALHRALAVGGVGLIITGHCYVAQEGKYSARQTGIQTDAVIKGLSAVTRAVHACDTPIFAQLNHAGSQSRIEGTRRLAPSAVPNPQTRRMPDVATDDEIASVVKAFGQAARRAREASFDGVHLHAGHGYLLTEFLSPHTNRRDDRWGGSLANRQRLLLDVLREIQAAAGSDFPVTVKLGMRDFVAGGLTLEDGLDTAKRLTEAGVQAIEVSAGLTSPKIESVVQYAGLTKQRALEDKLIHRLFAEPRPQAYFAGLAARLKSAITQPVILVGGLRSVEVMEEVLETGGADFLSLARPLIREPDLVNQISAGRRGMVDCTSCNICQSHDGIHPLRCWRKTNRRLLAHAFYRFTFQLKEL